MPGQRPRRRQGPTAPWPPPLRGGPAGPGRSVYQPQSLTRTSAGSDWSGMTRWMKAAASWKRPWRPSRSTYWICSAGACHRAACCSASLIAASGPACCSRRWTSSPAAIRDVADSSRSRAIPMSGSPASARQTALRASYSASGRSDRARRSSACGGPDPEPGERGGAPGRHGVVGRVADQPRPGRDHLVPRLPVIGII